MENTKIPHVIEFTYFDEDGSTTFTIGYTYDDDIINHLGCEIGMEDKYIKIIAKYLQESSFCNCIPDCSFEWLHGNPRDWSLLTYEVPELFI